MIKVASIQLWHNDDESKQDRIAHAEQLIDSAADCDLILLPELWDIGWWSFDIYHQVSGPLPGETVSRIAEKARRVNAYILAGSIVERDGDSLYNTAVMLDPKGQIIATYRKIHLVGFMGARFQLWQAVRWPQCHCRSVGYTSCQCRYLPECGQR